MSIQVTIPFEMERFVEQQVAAGHFIDASEVVQAALELMRKVGEEKLKRLRALLDEAAEEARQGKVVRFETEEDFRRFLATL